MCLMYVFRNYMNDSLQTTVFVQYAPETIACACIYLAARVLQIALPNRPHWFYLFNATEEDIEKICVTLLCVYQTVKTPYEELEKKVDACREVLQREKMKAKGITIVDELNKNAASSPNPSSKPSSPSFESPKDGGKQPSTHRSSTVPTGRDDNGIVANGSSRVKADGLRRSHDSRIKRSRTRSASSNRVKRYRKQSSESSSSSDESSPERRNGKSRSKDVLPKSYSQQNSNRYPDDRKHRRRKHDGKSRHSKHRRNDREGHKSRDSNKRHDETSKKHKRKHSPDGSPGRSRVNGEKEPSPSRKHRHRSHRDSHKKKVRRSESPESKSRR